METEKEEKPFAFKVPERFDFYYGLIEETEKKIKVLAEAAFSSLSVREVSFSVLPTSICDCDYRQCKGLIDIEFARPARGEVERAQLAHFIEELYFLLAENFRSYSYGGTCRDIPIKVKYRADVRPAYVKAKFFLGVEWPEGRDPLMGIE